jgi:hypothetical protein
MPGPTSPGAGVRKPSQTRTLSGVRNRGRLAQTSHQLHSLQARTPVLADDDVVVHGDAERGGDVDDRLRHPDVRLRRRRVATGMIVHQDYRAVLLRNELATSDDHHQRMLVSTGVIYF